MEKKRYITPEMRVYKVDMPVVLNSTSSIGIASDEDYNSLDDMLDGDGTLYAD